MEINPDDCLAFENVSIKDAMRIIEKNQHGFVVAVNKSRKVTGVVTDGDIRRGLIEKVSLDDKLSVCMNTNFIWASVEESREQILKKLDSQIRFIPVLDRDQKLKYIVSNKYFPLADEQNVYIRARAPVRVSFGGGGSDLTHYFKDSTGAVVNAAISIYSNCSMRVRSDSKIIVHSYDLNATLAADDLEGALIAKGPFGLIQAILHVANPKFGFELSIHSDFTVGSGLGGSATVAAAILGCFNQVRKDPWNQHELAEIAFQAERLHLGVAGGWQDQYASIFGGFNFIEFHKDENIVTPIRIQENIAAELEERLVLCNTGIEHSSGRIHEDQRKTMASSSVKRLVETNVQLARESCKNLLRGNLDGFGECLDNSWQLKKKFSTLISNNQIDDIYDGAMENGACGGKLLGAGSGGYFIFYTRPFKKFQFLVYVTSIGLMIERFRFEPEGLKTWVCRDN